MGSIIAAFVIPFVIGLAVGILMIIAYWIVFTKAGKPGWAILIPIYNIIVLLQIVGKPWWWLFLLLIPIVNIIIGIIVIHRVSLSFGKDVGFTLGLIFLSVIFWPILAFGKAVYLGPGGPPPAAPAAAPAPPPPPPPVV
jgi:hypothetical protein